MRARETQKFAFFFHFLPPQEEHLSISTTRAPPLAAFFAATGAAFFFSIFFLARAFLAGAFLAPPLVRVVAIGLDVNDPFFFFPSFPPREQLQSPEFRWPRGRPPTKREEREPPRCGATTEAK